MYVKGEDNTVADALSRLPPSLDLDLHVGTRPIDYNPSDDNFLATVCLVTPASSSLMNLASFLGNSVLPELSDPIAAVFSISSDLALLKEIKSGYASDSWIQNLIANPASFPTLRRDHGLWFLDNQLLIPRIPRVRELFFQLAHDCLGHFGFDKSYASLRDEYYWPNMHRDLKMGYVKGCHDCAQKKLTTHKKFGPLHPLPVPDGRFKSVALDFIGPLPEDDGFNCILTMTDRPFGRRCTDYPNSD